MNFRLAIVVAGLLAMGCYAARADTVIYDGYYSGPYLGASTSISLNADDIGYSSGPFDILFGSTTRQWTHLSVPIRTSGPAYNWTYSYVDYRQPNALELTLYGENLATRGYAYSTLTFNQFGGPGNNLSVHDPITPVPEMSTMLMLTLGLGLLALPKLVKIRGGRNG